MQSPDNQSPSDDPFDLSGRKVLITGAGGGVGRAIALAFSRRGARVAVNDVNRKGVEETLALMASGGVAAVGDVGACDDARRFVEGAIAELVGLDILVNNAAVITSVVAFVDQSPEDAERDIRIGLLGTLNVTRAALPAMTARRSGSIVNIASDAGRAGNGRLASYSATKGGIIAFTKALAQEVGPSGITVNAVSPGSVRAPMRDQILQDIDSRLGAEAVAAREKGRLEQYPMRRIAEPEDIANAVLFFSSAAASDITGQTLSVNGGFRMY